MSSRHRAFTLVELLVVVGIVTLLVALLMPALGKARKQALEVKCAANLRSIGQGLMMYTQRYGYYPGCVYAGPDSHVIVWPTRLREFLGPDRGVFNCPARGPEMPEWSVNWQYGSGTYFATKAHTAYGYEIGEPLLIPGRPFSYDYNAHGLVFSWGTPTERQLGLGAFLRPETPAERAIEMKASRVKLASEMIAVADTADRSSGWGLCANSYPPYQWPGTVHRRGANVLFCDGHVRWYAQADLVVGASLGGPPPGGPSPAAIRNRRIWNNGNQDYVP